MFIEFDLNRNDFDALMRHCQTHRPSTGDAREDQRLLDALEALLEAMQASDQASSQS
ncbi:hypothetical protein N8H41_06095 [Pseudomonas vlassakiae]|jgi:hypothetical protein|uniref:Uncharacterized protein n=1 Tax=Pseudomonas viciae TaxID=2505979 RepID=A0ABY8P6R2_9PSED|nr:MULTISPECIES: hypothetical protein [Pseudomonas]MCU0123546.1 hypothetical protein [Pseudomonas vlassakiae]WGO90918.1 hypothetical protein QCD61_14310 [Pseudomonas viciae]